MSEETKPTGEFLQSLVRNNKQIREDRAASIAEDTQLAYKRMIEDLEMKSRKMRRERENMLDLSPSNAHSLVLASDFDAQKFVEKDCELALKIRNNDIQLELAKESFKRLFAVE